VLHVQYKVHDLKGQLVGTGAGTPATVAQAVNAADQPEVLYQFQCENLHHSDWL
jgi:hypothetical protein